MERLLVARSAVLFALAALLSLMPASARAESSAIVLSDSTVLESWQLSNGLRVVTRHIPLCRSVDVTVAYRFGSSEDPAGREGLAALLAELAFLCPTVESPARSRAEMDETRPAGWNLAISPHVTQLSELARADRFPGVLHQVAVRMRGVRVTPASMRAALATVRADLDSNYRVAADRALYYGSRVWAERGRGARFAGYASGKGIQGVSAREAQQLLRRRFVPANAVLSIAGNLTGVPVRALIRNEFESIPAGSALPPPPAERLDSASCVITRPGQREAVGVLGVIAPALTDSIHPAFLMQMLLLGGHCAGRWGPPAPPLTSRFQYSFLDDPALVRFYPPLDPAARNPALLDVEFINTVSEVAAMRVPPSSYEAIREGVDWLLGGPLSLGVWKRLQNDGGALHTVCSGMATRELWGGEAFWSEYRRRFEKATREPLPDWYARVVVPQKQVRLLFVPPK